MNLQTRPAAKRLGWRASLVAAIVLTGCSSTSSISWDSRIGTYSWDDALVELGTPDRVADLEGGVKAGEWITPRSIRGSRVSTGSHIPSYTRGESLEPMQTYGTRAPDKVLRLMFTPDGKLLDWDRNY